MTLADELSMRGVPYGIRKNGSIFMMENGLIVELGLCAKLPEERYEWIVLDKRFVLVDRTEAM